MNKEKPIRKQVQFAHDVVAEITDFCKRYWDEDELIVASEKLRTAKDCLEKWLKENP